MVIFNWLQKCSQFVFFFSFFKVSGVAQRFENNQEIRNQSTPETNYPFNPDQTEPFTCEKTGQVPVRSHKKGSVASYYIVTIEDIEGLTVYQYNLS